MENFCKFHEITEDQFKGLVPIKKSIIVEGDSIPAGFNPVLHSTTKEVVEAKVTLTSSKLEAKNETKTVTVLSDLDLRNVKTIPHDFHPKVQGWLRLDSVTEVPADFNPDVYFLDLRSATVVPDGFDPDVDILDLNFAALPDGFDRTMKCAALNMYGKNVTNGFAAKVVAREKSKYYGVEPAICIKEANVISGDFSPEAKRIYFDELTTLSGNFSPKVQDDLVFDKLTSLSGNFSPEITDGSIRCGLVQHEQKTWLTIDGNFTPKVKQEIEMNNVTSISGNFSPELGGSLYLEAIKELPAQFNPKVGESLDLSGVKTLPEGCNITVARSLKLNGLNTLPESVHFSVGQYLELTGLEALPKAFNHDLGEHCSVYFKGKLIKRGGDEAQSMSAAKFIKEFIDVADDPATLAFCEKYKLTYAQFKGEDKRDYSLDIDESTIPDGFAPDVDGNIGLGNLTTLPAGFNPKCSGRLDLGSLTSIAADFVPNAESLDLSGLTTLPERITLIVKGSINLSGLTALPQSAKIRAQTLELQGLEVLPAKSFFDGMSDDTSIYTSNAIKKMARELWGYASKIDGSYCSLKEFKEALYVDKSALTGEANARLVEIFMEDFEMTAAQIAGSEVYEGDLEINCYHTSQALTHEGIHQDISLPAGFNPNVDGDLILSQVSELPEGFSPIVSGLLRIDSRSLPTGFAPKAGSLKLSTESIPAGFNATVETDAELRQVSELPEGFSMVVGGKLNLSKVQYLPENFNISAKDLALISLQELPELLLTTMPDDSFIDTQATLLGDTRKGTKRMKVADIKSKLLGIAAPATPTAAPATPTAAPTPAPAAKPAPAAAGMSKEEFCAKFKLTEEQFTGQAVIEHRIATGDLKAIPDGFNPNIKFGLDLKRVTVLPDGFSPIVVLDLDLSYLTVIPAGFDPKVGRKIIISNKVFGGTGISRLSEEELKAKLD